MSLVHDALALLSPDDKAMRSRLLARLSVTGASPGGAISPQALAEEALTLAEEIGDPQLVAQALAALQRRTRGPGPRRAAPRANAEQIVALAARPETSTLELLGHRFLVVVHAELGDFAAHGSEIETFARLAERLRQPLLGWYTPLFRAAPGAARRQLRRGRAATGRGRRGPRRRPGA